MVSSHDHDPSLPAEPTGFDSTEVDALRDPLTGGGSDPSERVVTPI
jgi:hypothetical protein